MKFRVMCRKCYSGAFNYWEDFDNIPLSVEIKAGAFIPSKGFSRRVYWESLCTGGLIFLRNFVYVEGISYHGKSLILGRSIDFFFGKSSEKKELFIWKA